MTTITRNRPTAGGLLGGSLGQAAVEERARRRLAEQCAYAFCFDQVTLSYAQGTLKLSGRVPSFYLKQVLQTHLRNLDGVVQIDNQVDVVSATGVSSVRPR